MARIGWIEKRMKTLRVFLKAVFALLALVIGAAIVGWVLSNEFVARLPEYWRPPLVGMFDVAPAMVWVGVHWGRQVVRKVRGNVAAMRGGVDGGERS